MVLYEKVDKDLNDIVFVYTTCSSLNEAKSIGLSAIKERLAISADYWIINSIYPWKNVIQDIDQSMLVFATQKRLGEKLIKHIEAEHSYSVPVIIMSNSLMTNQSYSFWVDNTLSSKDKYITEEEHQLQKKKKNDPIYGRLK